MLGEETSLELALSNFNPNRRRNGQFILSDNELKQLSSMGLPMISNPAQTALEQRRAMRQRAEQNERDMEQEARIQQFIGEMDPSEVQDFIKEVRSGNRRSIQSVLRNRGILADPLEIAEIAEQRLQSRQGGRRR